MTRFVDIAPYIGVFALVVDIQGTVIATHSRDGADWLAYEDVSE